MVWAGVSKLNSDKTEQSFNKTELEQNRSSYMVWAGILKQNRTELHGLSGRFETEQRTEQVELHGLGGRFETEQS